MKVRMCFASEMEGCIDWIFEAERAYILSLMSSSREWRYRRMDEPVEPVTPRMAYVGMIEEFKEGMQRARLWNSDGIYPKYCFQILDEDLFIDVHIESHHGEKSGAFEQEPQVVGISFFYDDDVAVADKTRVRSP